MVIKQYVMIREEHYLGRRAMELKYNEVREEYIIEDGWTE